VFHEDNFFSELRSLVSGYEDVTKDLIRKKCQYSGLFVSSVVPVVGDRRKFYKDEKPIEKLKNKTDQFVAEHLFKEIQLLTTIKADYVKKFEKNAKAVPEIKSLMTIPGIMEVRANTIAAIVCSPKRFRNKNKFWSYCMLVRHARTSDGKNYGTEIKFGNRTLKNVFMGAAESIIMGESELRDYFQHFIDLGLDRRTARKNLARKIAATALAVMRNNKPYDEKLIVKELETRKNLAKKN
jgi:transposase